jgi:hypothetical protein
MITLAIVTGLVSLAGIIIGFLPLHLIPPVGDYGAIPRLMEMLSYVFYIFPRHLFIMVIANWLGWQLVHYGWSAIVWIYNKFPGVN